MRRRAPASPGPRRRCPPGSRRSQGTQQPHRQGHQDAQPARVDAPHERQPQHPERDGHDAHVEPEQGHQPVEAEIGVGRLDGRSGSDARSSRPSRSGAAPRRRRLRPSGSGSRPSRCRDGPARVVAEKSAKPSFTITCASVTSSGPSLRTVRSMRPGSSTVRSTARSSTGGPLRSASPGPSSSANAASASAISASGTAPRTQAGTRPAAPGGAHIGARLHQATTSNRPIQPSCANSDW